MLDDDLDDIVVQTAADTRSMIDVLLASMVPVGDPDCGLAMFHTDTYLLAAAAARLKMIKAVDRGDADAARQAHATIRRRQCEAASAAGYDPRLVGLPPSVSGVPR